MPMATNEKMKLPEAFKIAFSSLHLQCSYFKYEDAFVASEQSSS